MGMAGGIGYTGHNDGQEVVHVPDDVFMHQVIYPIVFITSLTTVLGMVLGYWMYFGTFFAGHRYPLV
eukprot:NODE_7813_length_383_cov_536.278443_g6113_i0.p3 GENE.NODE_7813_length_383_cov_536.278443_g6113_i0~~NODE_7813_length_383_cov_536.278443_g6113_i0.p3  ORF type:complete len:74 (+),score=39.32 NODE_7813_length_383_cov_536.278443_g6113_i0:23-223(+)